MQMMNKAMKYEKYKDSGVEWLGVIPSHWEVKKLKFLGNIYAGLNGKKGDDFTKEFSAGIKSYIPFTNICNNIKISENQFHYVKVDKKENQNRVLKNDILFLMSSETLEDIAKNSIYIGDNEELYLNSFCKGFRISNEKVYPEYINYLFLSATYRSYFTLVGRGFTRINLKQEFINDAFALIPPIPEQTAIAAFLDSKTALIDQAINIKQKQIELLKERRQILIHKAVTRGVTSSEVEMTNVKMKDSGVEWIGEIPEGWEVKPIKHIANVVLGKMLCNEDKGNYQLKPYLKSKNIQWLNVDVSSVDEMWFSKKELIDYRLKKGDLVLSEGGEVGKTCIWNNELEECYIQNSAHKVTFHTNNSQVYYLYLLFTAGKIGLFEKIVNRVSIGHLTKDKLINIEVIQPPLDEQLAISNWIEKASSKIDTAISLKEQEIEKLKEYKASLINSAVTGKIKVS